MNSKSLEIKLKKNAKNRGLILRKAKNSPNTLQIISAFLYFGILMIQLNRETRKNIAIKER